MKNVKAVALAIVAFLAGVSLRSATAAVGTYGNAYPTNGWPVKPHMVQPSATVDERMCYVGTDGNLYLMPTQWSVPL